MPQCTHFSRSNDGKPSSPSVIACPEHIANAGLVFARNAEANVAERHVIGKAWQRLYLASHQQGILLRDKQTPIECDLRPAARGHPCVMQRTAIKQREFRNLLALESLLRVRLGPPDLLVRGRNPGLHREASSRKSRESHADQALHRSPMKAVASVLCFPRAKFHQALAPSCFIGSRQILLSERLARSQQLKHRFSKLGSRSPCFIDSGNSSTCWCYPNLPQCVCKPVPAEERLTALAGISSSDFAPQERIRPSLRCFHSAGC